MNQKTTCPRCETTFEVAGEVFNTIVSCPNCDARFNPMQELTDAAWEFTKTPEFQAALEADAAKGNKNHMKEFLKSIGFFVLGVVLMVAALTLVVLFFRGAAWLSENVLPVINLVSAVTFLVLLLVFLPLSIFRKCRGWCAVAFIYWSYLCGLSLWMTSLLVTLNLWGFVAAIIGLIFMGVGILPVALLACIFKGEWSIFFQLILQLAFLIGCRLFGFYLAHKAEQEELWDTKEKRDRSRQFMKPWLRWILVLPATIGAWIGIQLGIILVSGIIDIAWFGGLGGANDTHLVQFLNTIASAWAFVFAGAKTAPSNRGATAMCLTALFILGSFGAIFLAQGIESGKEFWGTEWSLICSVASALTMLIMCYEICREEKQVRDREMEERESILR